MTRVFDGHNDILTTIHSNEGAPEFLNGGTPVVKIHRQGDHSRPTHLDVPRALEARFCGGMFAIMAPADLAARRVEIEPVGADDVGVHNPRRHLALPVDHDFAQRFTIAVLALAYRLERASAALRIVRDASQLDADGIGMVLHVEGAEAIDTGLNSLEVLYAAGLRSLGLVWSRPNAFAEGVPFKFPESPDTGPGLTGPGRDLVQACNEIGVVVDLSHLNEKGFWDVAKLSGTPLVASHSNAHALCPHTRNLTDEQLDAVAASGGIVGVNFGVAFLTEHGPAVDTSVSASEIVRHFVYLAGRMGVDHVGFGSDFDGTRIPDEIGSVAGLPKLVELLRKEFSEDDLERITHRNWFRVLDETWRPARPPQRRSPREIP